MKSPIHFLFAVIFTVVSLPVLAQPGSGSSLEFNGTSSYVDAGAINLDGSDLTLSTWIKVNSFKTGFPFISSIMGTEVAGSASAFVRLGDAGLAAEKVQFIIRVNGVDVKLDGSQSLSAGKWYHIATTYDGAEMRIYINGRLDASQAQTGSISSNDLFAIGRNFENSRTLDGEMDEVRVWKSALSQNTIRNWMCKKLNTAHPDYANLEAYWRMDDATGNTAADLGPNGYNGSFVSSPSWKTSGAPIGDVSVNTYPGSAIGLGHPAGDSIRVHSFGGSPNGIHLYRVDSVPNSTTIPAGYSNLDSSRYWGVFVVGNSGTYDFDYYYAANPNVMNPCNLGWLTRANNAAGAWQGTTIANVDYANSILSSSTNGSGEFIYAETPQGPVSITLTSTDNTCFGESNGTATAMGVGGLTPYTYQWSSSNNTTANETGLPSGWVSVTVVDANNCASIDSVLITEPAELVLTVDNVVDVACEGGDDGSIVVVVSGGNPPVTLLWDDAAGQVSATAIGLEEGLFTVMGTDANNCQENASATVGFINAAPDVDLGPDVAANASFYDIVAPGGFADYEWSNGGNSAQTRVFSAGTYTVTVTDDNGCTGTDEIVISKVYASGVADEAAAANGFEVAPNPSQGLISVTLTNKQNEQIQVYVSDLSGKMVHSESLRPTASEFKQTMDLSGLASGTYLLRWQSKESNGASRLVLDTH